MAFMDTDEFGNEFINVNQRVDSRSTGINGDLLTVQALLQIIYQEGEYAKYYNLGNQRKVKVTVTGVWASDTRALIENFRSRAVDEVKPQAFIEKAIGNEKTKFAIFKLAGSAAGVLWTNAGGVDVDVRSTVVKRFPLLAAWLQPTAKSTLKELSR